MSEKKYCLELLGEFPYVPRVSSGEKRPSAGCLVKLVPHTTTLAMESHKELWVLGTAYAGP